MWNSFLGVIRYVIDMYRTEQKLNSIAGQSSYRDLVAITRVIGNNSNRISWQIKYTFNKGNLTF